MLSSRAAKIIVFVLCSSFVISIIPRSLNNKVKADTHINYSGEKQSSDCSYRSVEKASFTAEVKTTNKWSGHSNIEIMFKNTGKETIHDWYFTFDFNYMIENPVNCCVIENKDNLYTIGNNDWNQDILPGKSVTIGFTASSRDGSDIKEMPVFYLLNTETVTLKSGDLIYKYEEYSNWSSGFDGALILTNKTKESIRDWTITFGANRPITQADSSLLTNNADGTYVINNDGNNQNIAKGQTYRIGIRGGSNDSSIAFALTDYTVTAKKMALKLTDDKDKNGIADVLEVDFNGAVTVTPTEIPTSTPTATSTPSETATPTATNKPTSIPVTNTPTNTSRPTSTNTPNPSVTQKPTVTNTPTSKPTITTAPTVEPTVTSAPTILPTMVVSVTPTNTVTTTPVPTASTTGFPDDIDYEKDTDKDGLPDDLEDYYGTDKNKIDTDGDGVNDLFELMLETDPLTKDDNGNNDFDNDGLTNAKESQLGTDPTNRDSDLDGLTDGYEVNLYGTDPKKYDTDDDGISDAGEISLGSNPKSKDSDIQRRQTLTYYPKADAKIKGVTRIEVSGYISGYIEENTKIRDISDSDPHTASIDALVGIPVSIETSGEFDEMMIKFYYEEGDFDEDDLRVLWYDEENFRYEVIDVEKSRINYDANYFYIYTDHFSKYMLIDQGKWVKSWASGMLQAGEASALSNHYTLEGYRTSMKNLPDSDKDGLPDVLEKNGMVTNIGALIRTNPNNPDTDGDGLTDGYEMGELCLTKYAYELGTFQYYVRYWYAAYGMRPDEWVFFCMRSNPTLSDSDGDDATDGEDATPNEKNKPINYILIGMDKPEEDKISCMKQPYIDAFIKLGQEVVVLEMCYGSDYYKKAKTFYDSNKSDDDPPFAVYVLAKRTFEWLKYDLTKQEIKAKKKNTYVDKMIIIAHGSYNWIEFMPDDDNGYISSEDVIKNVNPACKINLLDIQACYCAKPVGYTYKNTNGKTINTTTCIAYEFFKKNNILKVYAWTDQASFEFGQNVSIMGAYVEFYNKDTDGVGMREVKSYWYFWIWPAYKPLQY